MTISPSPVRELQHGAGGREQGRNRRRMFLQVLDEVEQKDVGFAGENRSEHAGLALNATARAVQQMRFREALHVLDAQRPSLPLISKDFHAGVHLRLRGRRHGRVPVVEQAPRGLVLELSSHGA